jgi:hypothetical protein
MTKKLSFLIFLFTQSLSGQQKTDYKFTFGSKEIPGYIRVENAITVYLAGNSTVVDQDDDPWASWGQMFL